MNLDYDFTKFDPNYQSVNLTEYDVRKLVELLQRSAVELLTTFRQLEAREFGSVATKLLLAYECYTCCYCPVITNVWMLQ